MNRFLVLLLSVTCFAFSPTPNPNAVVTFGSNMRFTVLGPQMFRIQRGSAPFDDRPTLAIVNRDTPVPEFTVDHPNATSIVISTKNATLAFDSSFSLSVSSNGVTWHYGDTPQNLKGTLQYDFSCSDNQPIETCLSSLKNRMQNGLVNKDGWSVYSDLGTLRRQEVPTQGIPWIDYATNHSSETLDLYVWIYGDDFMSALQQFSTISGPPSLLPQSALGVWWSHYYQFSEETYNEILTGYRTRDLPLNNAVLDMGWHNDHLPPPCNGYGGFTWNTSLFPNPLSFEHGLATGSNAYGKPLRLLLNLHPQDGVDVCNGDGYYEMAKRLDFDTSHNATIPCDMGNETWASSLFDIFLDNGNNSNVSYWWTDYTGCMERSNPYRNQAMIWSNAVYYEHLESMRKERSLVLTRWNGIGEQRYPVFFTGDTHQCFEVLQFEIENTPTAANVMTQISHDIGGFKPSGIGPGCVGTFESGNGTQGELYLRWLQFGAVSPIMRTHCTSCVGRDTFAPCVYCERRIWHYPQYEAMKDSMLLRNSLVPYLYTTHLDAITKTSLTLTYPLYYRSPHRNEAYTNPGTYFLGGGIVTSPIFSPVDASTNETQQFTWFPDSTSDNSNSFCGHDGKSNHVPGSNFSMGFPQTSFPLYFECGTIFPLRKISSSNANFADPIVWTMFDFGVRQGAKPGQIFNGANGYVLEDDGNSLNISQVANSSVAVTYDVSNKVITVIANPTQGSFSGLPTTRAVHVHIRGYFFHNPAPSAVYIDSKLIPQISPNSSLDPTKSGWYSSPSSTAIMSFPQNSLVIQTGSPLPISQEHVITIQE